MDAYLTFNLTNPDFLLVLKNRWRPTHQLVRMTQQLTKHMRTHGKFLLDRLSIYTSSKLLPDSSSNNLQRPYLLTWQCRRCFRF